MGLVGQGGKKVLAALQAVCRRLFCGNYHRGIE